MTLVSWCLTAPQNSKANIGCGGVHLFVVPFSLCVVLFSNFHQFFFPVFLLITFCVHSECRLNYVLVSCWTSVNIILSLSLSLFFLVVCLSYCNFIYITCDVSVDRYVELNVRYSGYYRQYSSSLPKWLQDRPRDFVMHVLDRFRKAASISIDSITVDSPGMFRVCKGADRGNTNVSANGAYRVCFGDDSSLPSCECEDWLRHYRPCKHMCAIFHQFPEHSWDSLSHLYSGNVIFKLDETLVSENDMNTRDAGQCVTDVIFSNNHDHDTVNDETNSESETERTAGVCRELLKQCMDFTYLCTEQQPLHDLAYWMCCSSFCQMFHVAYLLKMVFH